MTPLTLLVTTMLRNRARVLLGPRVTCALVCRPRGVLHAYVGPLTRSGRFVPRELGPICGAHTLTLGVVPHSEVRDRPVCARCTARLLSPVQEAGHPTRAELLAAYSDVTPFDLALDAWRAETADDVERVQHAALLLFGVQAAKNDPVVAPTTGKVTGPLDAHIARAYRRLGISRDPLGAHARAVAIENEAIGRDAVRRAKKTAWQDREDRIARLGFVNATARPRTA